MTTDPLEDNPRVSEAGAVRRRPQCTQPRHFSVCGTAMLKPLGRSIRALIIPALASSFRWVSKARASCSRFPIDACDFNASVAELTKQLTVHARVGEEVAMQLPHHGWEFVGVDPRRRISDASIGDAIEHYTAHRWIEWHDDGGACDYHAVKAVKVRQVGYSG